MRRDFGRLQMTANPMTDKISVRKFHHVEFYCGDATNTYKRFLFGLGMEFISKSDQSTGNTVHASYVLQSGDMKMIFTAPYSATPIQSAVSDVISETSDINCPFPKFSSEVASSFFQKHGFGVRSVAIEVADVTDSYNTMILNGAVSSLKPLVVCGTWDVLKLGFFLKSDARYLYSSNQFQTKWNS